MRNLILFLSSIFLCANLISGEHRAIYPKDRVGAHIHVLFGVHVSAFYERRFNDIFALELGAVGGETFVGRGFSRLTHGGPYVGANLYATPVNAQHHFYFSPSLAMTYGTAKISLPSENWERLRGLSLNGSIYFIYRYLFKSGLSLETGVGVDAVHVVFPWAHKQSVRTFSLPIPKLELGLSYAF